MLLPLEITVTSERYPFSSLTAPLTVLNSEILVLFVRWALISINDPLERLAITDKKSLLLFWLLEITVKVAEIFGSLSKYAYPSENKRTSSDSPIFIFS